MIIIYFFYGLAFIFMGIIIFVMPKRSDFLNLSDDLWLVGLFGLFHGFNEWIDLFILRGKPFDIEVLKVIGGFLLPVSYIFLVIFSCRVISRQNPKLKWLGSLWVICLLIWVLAYIFSKDFLITGIVARYFICLPGTSLSAFGLYIRSLKSDRKPQAKTFSLSVLVIVFTFIIYGLLSGLVVPQANFLFASLINYTNFTKAVGLPVQFFRMLCAIFLMMGFFGLTRGFYYVEERIRFKGGIRRKVTWLIFLNAFIIIVVGITLGYFWGFNLLFDTTGRNQQKMAELLTTSITGLIDKEIERIERYLDSEMLRKATTEHNAQYGIMEPEVIQRLLIDMDRKWIEAKEDSPLIKEYLGSQAGNRLKEYEADPEINEIFITDKFGGLVAASRKTSDFYQADEAWWKSSFKDGKGDIFIGDVEFDESSNAWAIPFAIPIRDSRGNVIGICKAVIDVMRLFAPLGNFKFGRTGHAAIINEDGYSLYHRGIKPSSVKLLSDEDFQRLIKSQNRWIITAQLYAHAPKKMFITFAEIEYPLFLKEGRIWKVFIFQEAEEILTPLNKFIFQMIVFTVILIMILIPLGTIFSGIFVKPIDKLHQITEHIAKGDFDYKIEIHTADEIEDLALGFNRMAKDLKALMEKLQMKNKEVTTTNEQLTAANEELNAMNEELQATTEELQRTNEELVILRQELERKVEERTAEIVATNKQLVREIEEHREAEESLRRLSSVVEQTVDSVIITDKNGIIEYVNPAFEKLTGYTKEETIGKTPRILRSGEHEQGFYEVLWKTILSGKIFHDTLINRKKNGEFYYTEKIITPLRDKQGNIVTFVSTDRDITERKEMEKTQRLTQLGKLVADMAHEVNNPLMVISGRAQLSLMEQIQNEVIKDNLKIIFEECQRARDIIQRLLSFSRPSKGELKEININRSIETVVGVVEHQFKLAGTEIKRNYIEKPLPIVADEKQIQEVVMNLLNNAKDAMPKGGAIEIVTSSENDFLRIDFKDTGSGISEEDIKRMFEPFFTTKKEGTGLGLSLCYGIVKAHGGDIKIESKLGKGTVVTVFLPVKEALGNA